MRLLKTYLGFAIKKNSVIIGVDNIISSKKQIKIILYSSLLSANSKEKLSKTKEDIIKKEIDDKDFINIISSEKIKAIAVYDNELSKAIINNI